LPWVRASSPLLVAGELRESGRRPLLGGQESTCLIQVPHTGRNAKHPTPRFLSSSYHSARKGSVGLPTSNTGTTHAYVGHAASTLRRCKKIAALSVLRPLKRPIKPSCTITRLITLTAGAIRMVATIRLRRMLER